MAYNFASFDFEEIHPSPLWTISSSGHQVQRRFKVKGTDLNNFIDQICQGHYSLPSHFPAPGAIDALCFLDDLAIRPYGEQAPDTSLTTDPVTTYNGYPYWEVTATYNLLFDGRGWNQSDPIVEAPWPIGVDCPSHDITTTLTCFIRLAGEFLLYPARTAEWSEDPDSSSQPSQAPQGLPLSPYRYIPPHLRSLLLPETPPESLYYTHLPLGDGSSSSSSSSGNPVPPDSPAGRLTIPEIEYRITWDYVYQPPMTTWRELLGKVNQTWFLGCEPETLLFEGAEIDPRLICHRTEPWRYTVTAFFRQRRIVDGGIRGWNHELRESPYGWVYVTMPDGTPRYKLAAFDSMFFSEGTTSGS